MKSNEKPQNRSERIAIYLTPELKDKLTKIAAERYTSASTFIMYCIKKEIDKEVG